MWTQALFFLLVKFLSKQVWGSDCDCQLEDYFLTLLETTKCDVHIESFLLNELLSWLLKK